MSILLLSALVSISAYGGSTGQTALHMPQGTDAGTANGDYVSDEGGLNTVYRYWIEVPPGLGRLVVEIFDADIGRGGAGEDDAGRDRDRADGFTGNVDYTLLRPDGSTAATLLDCDFNTCNDNVWTEILDSTTSQNTAAGHWELRVDQSNGDELNAIGIRAHDNTPGAGGTELNVYVDSMVSLGVNPDPGANARTYALHPWITSGCQCSQNDFDRDSNSGNVGSVTYTSRTGAFTQTFNSATLSTNDDWNHDNLTRWGDDDESDEYGIWTVSSTINTYTTPAQNGNYETYYVGSYLISADPTTNPILSGGNPAAFRLYLPTDTGAAPVKPYMEQFLTHNRNFAGPNPPQVNQQSVFTVTVRLRNPTAYALTFNASNLITANVPAGVTYGGGANVSQGSIVAQPTVGTTGNITWNPGSVAAGATILLSYNVRVTPTSAGQRLTVTATPASGNGTRAQFIDETGNATQARARYIMGGLCELAVTQGLATPVVISKFNVDSARIAFTTASEAGTIGFNVYRADGSKVNDTMIPASLKPQGGKYELYDRHGGGDGTYIVEEVTASGNTNRIGPLKHLEGVDREEKQARGNERRLQSLGAAVLKPGAKVKSVAAMVGVRETGVVRVPAADLANALGTTVAAVQSALQTGKVSVTNNGTLTSWETEGQSLYFFGEKSTSIYSNDRVYMVELSARGLRMETSQVTGASGAVSSFTATQDVERDLFAATVLPLDPESDYWFWEYVLSGDATYGFRTFDVDVPAMASNANATLSVRLQGAYKDASHRAKISLNGVPIGEVNWNSFDAHTATISIPAAVLRDGANQVAVEGVLPNGASFDVFYVDGFSINYQKYARPQSGRLQVSKTGTLSAGPFAMAPYILDITSRARPKVLYGASFAGGVASLNVPAKTKELFFAESYPLPSFVRGSGEKMKNQQADWVVIAPRDFRAAAESLASLRSRDGLTTLVVDLEQVYDDFAGGNTTPHAIQDFILSTRNWSKKPKYFVLAGTGTVDYRGITVAPGPLPPMMTSTADGLFASDSLFADRNGDRLPDLAIGRIPVSSAAELSDYVAKLDRNANIAFAQSPILFGADASDQGTDFRIASAAAEATMDTRPQTQIYVDNLGSANARTQLLAAWKAGTSLVNWVGHGGLDQISSTGLLTSYDRETIATSTGRLPVLIAMTCTINRFENGYVDPLGTALTKDPDGGAVAVWSASGLSVHAQASDIQRTFMRLAALQPSQRIGDLIVAALAQHPGDTSSLYLLLGDPAVKLDLPSEVSSGTPGTAGE
ncbi:MAG TPA: C25 family cysteine peptidase [Thermoanaerobaculia bacterium]|nr:C25 family cysteine peptidase [Thermoanaerobaculia bacterium]